MKRGQETPAPNQYKEGDQAIKMSRFKNIHMGTDVKSTLKDIALTPGPGHYLRVDEQFAKTFHHATKHGSAISPVFNTISQKSNNTSMKVGENSRFETENDPADPKSN